jgi:hypothetical protein
MGYAAGAVVAFVYFFPTPMAFSTAIALLLAVGCVRSKQALATSR